MSKTGEKKSCDWCKQIGLRPFTMDNVLYYYMPIQSLVSYAALSVNVMNPALAIKLIPKKDVTNFLLIHTLFGTTLYMYNRPHLKSITGPKRVAYSVFGSVMFSMGSVLIWAVIRSAIPKNNSLTTVLGIASGVALAKLGYDYVEHIDQSRSSSSA